MTLANQILNATRGANEARNFAINEGATQTNVNGMEIWRFWQDSSVLVIIGGIAVIAGKGN